MSTQYVEVSPAEARAFAERLIAAADALEQKQVLAELGGPSAEGSYMHVRPSAVTKTGDALSFRVGI